MRSKYIIRQSRISYVIKSEDYVLSYRFSITSVNNCVPDDDVTSIDVLLKGADSRMAMQIESLILCHLMWS